MKKQLIFIGGGHAHVLVLKRWAEDPLPDVDLVLVSPAPNTPYSGMLPGLVAGHYRFEETHIDLVTLCQQCQVNFVQASATHIDVDKKKVSLDNGQTLDCDLVSFDCGSTPDLSVEGAADQVVPVKPIAGFYKRWQTVNARIREQPRQQQIAVVGGGTAGVELTMAMHYFWRQQPGLTTPQLHLVQAGQGLPENYPHRVQQIFANYFQAMGIQVHENFEVQSVNNGALYGKNGQVACDEIFWCTHASAQQWIKQSGISTTESGFIKANDSLQSLSHPWIFAAGDIVHQCNHPRPKAGVYAVRQAPILYENLRRYCTQQPLLNHKPQSQYLSLIGRGDKYAVGSKYGITVAGAWVWRWKEAIDRRFMAQFPQPNPDPQ